MNNLLDERTVSCPYCADPIVILLDGSAGDQSYIEDCQVCCRPMQISFAVDSSNELDVQVSCAD